MPVPEINTGMTTVRPDNCPALDKEHEYHEAVRGSCGLPFLFPHRLSVHQVNFFVVGDFMFFGRNWLFVLPVYGLHVSKFAPQPGIHSQRGKTCMPSISPHPLDERGCEIWGFEP